jgi:hypothetical protein
MGEFNTHYIMFKNVEFVPKLISKNKKSYKIFGNISFDKHLMKCPRYYDLCFGACKMLVKFMILIMKSPKLVLQIKLQPNFI